MDAELREYAIRGIEAELSTLRARQEQLTAKLSELRNGGTRKMPKIVVGSVPEKKRRPQMSEEGRKRIAEAQKARWAARRAAQVGMARPEPAAVAAEAPEPEVARPPMPRHVKKANRQQRGTVKK